MAYAKIFQQARKDGVVVLLDGQGMDEQWAGYDYYAQKNNNTIQGVKTSPFKKEVLSNELLDLAKKPNYPKPFKEIGYEAISISDLKWTRCMKN